MDIYAIAIEEIAMSGAVMLSCKTDRSAARYRLEINRRLEHAGADWRVVLDNDRRTLRAVPQG